MIVSLPERVQAQFETVDVQVRERRHLVRWELAELARVLKPLGGPVLALKGAAYELQGLPMATGRKVGDIDLLVAPALLARAEQLLKAGGWQADTLDPHDERYYRQWSHEIPPLRHPSRELELDLHHAITPDTKGAGIDTLKLMAAARNCGDFLVLDPLDQVIHCAVHTFKDSDLSMRLREVMDFDLLVRAHSQGKSVDFSRALLRRAQELGAGDSVRWAARYAMRWLDTPLTATPDIGETQHIRAEARPWMIPSLRAWAMDRLLGLAMLPGAREAPQGSVRIARTALLIRYHLNRMPLFRLLPHLARKSLRRWRDSRRAVAAQTLSPDPGGRTRQQ